MDDTTYEGWAIVELMGHVRLGAYVTEAELAGAGFLRLEVPEHTAGGVDWPAATQFINPSSLYRLTPCTEEMARQIRPNARPIETWELPRRELEPARVGSDPDDPFDELDEQT